MLATKARKHPSTGSGQAPAVSVSRTVFSCFRGPILVIGIVLSLQGARAQSPRTTWSDYSGSADSAQYSALRQIDRSNVHTLKVAWTYPTLDQAGYSFNPLVVDGVIYVLAKNNAVVALDAATGKELWLHENRRGKMTTRGIRPAESTTGKAKTARIAACCSPTTSS